MRKLLFLILLPLACTQCHMVCDDQGNCTIDPIVIER